MVYEERMLFDKVSQSIALEGGMNRFKDDLPNFSKDDFNLIHEWNCCLRNVIEEPEFKRCLRADHYYTITQLPADSVSEVIDNMTTLYRSYHLAKMFLDSAHFVYGCAGQNAAVLNMESGLLPWGYVVKQNRPDVQIYNVSTPEINSIFSKVSYKLKLPPIHMNETPESNDYDKFFYGSVFVSTGFLMYLSKDEQKNLLRQINMGYKNLFIELGKPNAGQQNERFSSGAECKTGFSKQELERVITHPNIPFYLQEINKSVVKNNCVAQSIKNAMEQILIRS